MISWHDTHRFFKDTKQEFDMLRELNYLNLFAYEWVTDSTSRKKNCKEPNRHMPTICEQLEVRKKSILFTNRNVYLKLRKKK